MIKIYDKNDSYIGSAPSSYGAQRITGESSSVITKRLNHPIPGQIKYYTDDSRGHLVRLSYELYTTALNVAYPTPAQIGIISKAIRELLK